MKDIPWDKKYMQARHQVQIMKKSSISHAENYITMPLDERFKKLMILYNQMEPDWKSEYNKIERRKPKEVRTDLSAKNILDVVNGAIGEDLLELSMSMYVANKLAHQCKFIRNDILDYYFMSQIEEGKVGWTTDTRELYDLIERVLDPEMKKMPRRLQEIKEKLNNNYGVSQSVLDDLERKNGDDIRQITQLQRTRILYKRL